jgi:hypothetical protein
MLPRQISISRELREDFSAVDRAEARYLNSRESILSIACVSASCPGEWRYLSFDTECTAKEAPLGSRPSQEPLPISPSKMPKHLGDPPMFGAINQ